MTLGHRPINGYSLWNPIQNYQNDFAVEPGAGNTYADFFSGVGQFTYFGSTAYAVNSGCYTNYPAENSDMDYTAVSCGSASCTQNFNAPTGYGGHSAPGTSFNVQFGGGWGTTTVGVHQGDLLVATEATYNGGVSFNTPQDTLGNTWTPDGGVGGPGYCSPYDCVEIWHAVAKSSGSDTVTFYTSTSTAYTYGFLREFVGYSGAIDNSAHNSGSSGMPSVPSFTTKSGDLIIAVVATTGSNPYWGSGLYYYLMGESPPYNWSAVSEYGPDWQQGSTTAPFTTNSNGYWAELVVAYSPP